jgi:hypothetical protein
MLLSQGLKNKEKVYLSKLFQKVGVKDRFELALYGLKNLTAEQGQRADGSPHSNELRSLVLHRLR